MLFIFYSEMIILLGRRLVLVRFWIFHRWWNSSCGKSTQTSGGGSDVVKKARKQLQPEKDVRKEGKWNQAISIELKKVEIYVVENPYATFTQTENYEDSQVQWRICVIFNISFFIRFFLTSSTLLVLVEVEASYHHKGKSWRKKNLKKWYADVMFLFDADWTCFSMNPVTSSLCVST